MSDKPKHACRMVLEVNGHTRQDIADCLLDFACRVGNDECGTSGFGGGPSGSHEYTLDISDSPSAADYRRQLHAWLQERRDNP